MMQDVSIIKGYPLLGVLPQAKKFGPMEVLKNSLDTSKRFNVFRFGPMRLIHVLDPDLIYQVFTQPMIFRKSSFHQKLKIYAGEGLVTSEGELWKSQRKRIQPFFNRPLQ